jgi:hypothetical protein
MRNRQFRRLCLLLPLSMLAAAGLIGLGDLRFVPGASAAGSTVGWMNYQCSYTDPGAGGANFAVDGANMFWQETPTPVPTVLAVPTPFRLEGVNRSSNGRLATQTVQGPKSLKAFVISSEKGNDGSTARIYESVLEVITPKTIVGACTPLPFTYSARYVVGVLAGDSLNLRVAPSVLGKVLTAVEPNGFLWTTGRSSKTWVSVAAVVFPNGDRGAAEIVEGWATGRYVSVR